MFNYKIEEMMKNIKIVTILLFGILFSSCNDDFLELEPLDAIAQDKIFKDPGLAATYLNKVYSGIPNGFNRGWYMLDAASDDGENAYSWAGSNSRFNTSSITSSNSPFNGLWNNSYRQIRRLNIFIANYDLLEGDIKEVNRLKGEAHFLRGFYYAEMLKTYGGVPLISTAQDLETDDLLVARNSRVETTDFVVADLNEAANFLSNATDASASRASLAGTLALKGRVLLYEGRYTESATASAAAIAAADGLDSDYQKIFLEDGTKEVLFDMQFKDPDKGHWGNLFNTMKSTGSISGWGGTGPTQNLVDEYEMQVSGKMIDEAGSGYDAANPYDGRDPRFYATVLYDGAAWKGQTIRTRPTGSEHIDTSGDWTKTGYGLKKLIQEDRAHGDLSIQHWVFIRLGEVYLNQAEALIEANTNLSGAVTAINMVRQRSQMPDIVIGTQSELRAKLRHERRVELAFEEHRFWDIRRWGIGGDPEVLTIYKVDMDAAGTHLGKSVWETRNWNAKDVIFPIPQGEMDKNSNLTQNPGY